MNTEIEQTTAHGPTEMPPEAAAGGPPAKNDLTRGPIFGHVVRMTSMLLAGMVMQALYTLIDLYWVGRLGGTAIAAVSLSSNVMFVSFAMMQMLSVGLVALISQAAGRRDNAEVSRLFWQAISLSLLSGVLFAIAGLAVKDSYAQHLSADASTAAQARDFLHWFIIAMAVQLPLTAMSSSLRGIGRLKPGMITQAATILVNMILAPFLMFGWIGGHPMGVAGAAMATLLAGLFGVAGLAIYLARQKIFGFDAGMLPPRLAIWRRMLAIGLPAGLELLLMAVYMIFIYSLIRDFGADAQAGFGIGGRIMQTAFFAPMAVSFALAAVAGQNLGARNLQRIAETYWSALKLGIGLMLIMVLLCEFAPTAMVGRFTDDPAVTDIAVTYLRWVAVAFPFAAIGMVNGGLFQGIGDTWPALFSSATRMLVAVVPAWWLSHTGQLSLLKLWQISILSMSVQGGLSSLLLYRAYGRLGRKLEPAMTPLLATS
jgi:putative MATE family efflux protein